MRNIIIILIGFVSILVILSLWGFYTAIHPVRIISKVTPKDFNVPYKDVSFTTQDGIKISGWFIPSAKPTSKTIILLHGYPADKGDILASRLFLHKNYNLLFFDFRYFGESEGNYSTLGKNEVLDLLAAINYLRSQNINEIGVWGISLGAAVALMTAPKAPEIKAIVAESSYAKLDWIAYQYFNIPLLRYPLAELGRLWDILFLRIDIKTVSPVDAAKKINIPVLLIHSKKDDVIPFQNGLALKEALNHNPNLNVVFTNTSHGQLIKDIKMTGNIFIVVIFLFCFFQPGF